MSSSGLSWSSIYILGAPVKSLNAYTDKPFSIFK